MTTQDQSNEYRCLTPEEIGKAVAMFRNLAGIKQLTLALEAGVTERTVQRIENGVKLIDAYRFAALKDAEAVLGTHGMIVDDHFVTDDAADEVASFKDLLQGWNDVYAELFTHGEKLEACRSLVEGAQQVEARGYVIRYGVYMTEDKYRFVSVLIARRTDDALCEVKQMFVPNRFSEMSIT